MRTNDEKQLEALYEDRSKEEYNQYLYNNLSPTEQERYTIIPDLEGPIKLKSGKIVYYDSREGKYYDRDSDMYIDGDEIQLHSEDTEPAIITEIKNIQIEIASISNKVHDFLEEHGTEQEADEWLRLTGDAQIKVLEMVDFMNKSA